MWQYSCTCSTKRSLESAEHSYQATAIAEGKGPIPVFDKILFAKIGWAPNYEGEDCTGDFGEPNETDSWDERFNFLPGPNGRYYGYVLPMGPHESHPTQRTETAGW